MISSNAAEKEPHGLNVFAGKIEKISEMNVHDHRKTKEWAIRLASEVVITILRVDQIIIAKPAGGPKMPQKQDWDADEWSI